MNKNDLLLQVKEIEDKIRTFSPGNVDDLKSFVIELINESNLEFDYGCIQIAEKNYKLAFEAFIRSLENVRWIPVIVRDYKLKADEKKIKEIEKYEKSLNWVESRRDELKQLCQFLCCSWN